MRTSRRVFYAHGVIPPQAPVVLPVPQQDWDDIASLREALGQAGFAIAYSSFGENGYAITEGIQRTHQLRGIFTSRVGRPSRSFLIGHSLGAQVVQALAETYPGQYNGALAMCGVLGGTKFQIDYVGNTRALFDFFYPGVLPGNVMEMPENVDPVNQIQLPALSAVLSNQAPLPLIAFANQTRLAGDTPPEIITSLLNALVYHALGVNDLLAYARSHPVRQLEDVLQQRARPGFVLRTGEPAHRPLHRDAGRVRMAREQLRADG